MFSHIFKPKKTLKQVLIELKRSIRKTNSSVNKISIEINNNLHNLKKNIENENEILFISKQIILLQKRRSKLQNFCNKLYEMQDGLVNCELINTVDFGNISKLLGEQVNCLQDSKISLKKTDDSLLRVDVVTEEIVCDELNDKEVMELASQLVIKTKNEIKEL